MLAGAVRGAGLTAFAGDGGLDGRWPHLSERGTFVLAERGFDGIEGVTSSSYAPHRADTLRARERARRLDRDRRSWRFPQLSLGACFLLGELAAAGFQAGGGKEVTSSS